MQLSTQKRIFRAALPIYAERKAGDEMGKREPQGQYRTEPDGDRAPMVYVWGNDSPTYVTEATYRAKGYLPDFDELPTEDEYDAALTK